MLDLDEIKSRINPAYADRRGTESHERKQLCDEIDRLRAALQHETDIAEAYKAEADEVRAKLELAEACLAGDGALIAGLKGQ